MRCHSHLDRNVPKRAQSGLYQVDRERKLKGGVLQRAFWSRFSTLYKDRCVICWYDVTECAIPHGEDIKRWERCPLWTTTNHCFTSLLIVQTWDWLFPLNTVWPPFCWSKVSLWHRDSQRDKPEVTSCTRKSRSDRKGDSGALRRKNEMERARNYRNERNKEQHRERD